MVGATLLIALAPIFYFTLNYPPLSDNCHMNQKWNYQFEFLLLPTTGFGPLVFTILYAFYSFIASEYIVYYYRIVLQNILFIFKEIKIKKKILLFAFNFEQISLFFFDELKPYYNQNKHLTTLQKLDHHYIKAKALHAENNNTNNKS
jgi:hypothetical protein